MALTSNTNPYRGLRRSHFRTLLLGFERCMFFMNLWVSKKSVRNLNICSSGHLKNEMRKLGSWSVGEAGCQGGERGGVIEFKS